MAAEKGFLRPWQVKRFFNAARLAYGLNSCEALGLDSVTCHIEDGPHLVMFLDYHKEYLELAIADIGYMTFLLEDNVRLEKLGESQTETENSVSAVIL